MGLFYRILIYICYPLSSFFQILGSCSLKSNRWFEPKLIYVAAIKQSIGFQFLKRSLSFIKHHFFILQKQHPPWEKIQIIIKLHWNFYSSLTLQWWSWILRVWWEAVCLCKRPWALNSWPGFEVAPLLVTLDRSPSGFLISLEMDIYHKYLAKLF